MTSEINNNKQTVNTDIGEQLKIDILKNIGYTKLVYGRINKKLNTSYSDIEIEKLLLDSIQTTTLVQFKRKGKNYYITSLNNNNIRITINSNTFRVITVDSL